MPSKRGLPPPLGRGEPLISAIGAEFTTSLIMTHWVSRHRGPLCRHPLRRCTATDDRDKRSRLMDPALVRATMSRFADEVIPHLR
jgi:hypothetical protein